VFHERVFEIDYSHLRVLVDYVLLILIIISVYYPVYFWIICVLVVLDIV
jgi:hypothetical protein